MQKYFSLTGKQRKWLLAVTLLAFSFLLINVFSLAIESYNREVMLTELNNRADADGNVQHFIITNHYGITPVDAVANCFINFFFLPVSFLLLFGRSFWKFVFSTILIGTSLFHFCVWIIFTFQNFYTWEGELAQPLFSAQRVIPAGSNIFDILVLGCVVVLFIWQTAILLRVISRSWLNKPVLP